MSASPTLLLLAGNMCDARLWEGIVPTLAGWRTAAPPLREPTIAGMAARVLADTSDALIPIGFSMGGIVALEMARQAPERIAAMALVDTNPSADLPERAAARPRQQREVRAGGLERIVVDELKPNYLASANRRDQALRAKLRDMALALGAEIFVRQSEALRTRDDLRPVLREFERPLFIACGAEDRLCPPEWHRSMAKAASHAELHVIPGAGHMLPLERPAELAMPLVSWLQTIASADACLTLS